MDALVLPEGYRSRALRREDAEVAHGLVVAHHDATGGSESPPLAEVVADLAYPDIDLERDTCLVVEEGGRPVLYAIIYRERPLRIFFDLFIDPELPRDTRRELGVAAARAAIERVRVTAREHGLRTTIAESGMLRDDDLLPEVMAAVGMSAARTWWRMSADRQAISNARPRAPEGIRIVAVDPSSDEVLRVAHGLEEETFADHYGSTPATFEVFRTEYRNGAGYDPSAWWFAYDVATGEPAALLIGDDSRAEDGAGFVDTLGVRVPYRGRGVAGALLRTAFAEYARRGRTSVALSVDAKNETGAVALYERVGMTPIDVIVSWEKVLEV